MNPSGKAHALGAFAGGVGSYGVRGRLRLGPGGGRLGRRGRPGCRNARWREGKGGGPVADAGDRRPPATRAAHPTTRRPPIAAQRRPGSGVGVRACGAAAAVWEGTGAPPPPRLRPLSSFFADYSLARAAAGRQASPEPIKRSWRRGPATHTRRPRAGGVVCGGRPSSEGGGVHPIINRWRPPPTTTTTSEETRQSLSLLFAAASRARRASPLSSFSA